MTVKAALRLPALRVGAPEVIAGADALDQPVRWARAGDLPAALAAVERGELLLTTNAGLGRGAAAQRRVIAELADRGASAMAVLLRPAAANLPAPVVQEAGARELPLIVLRRDVDPVAAAEAVRSAIAAGQRDLLRRSEDLHERFTALLAEGAAIPEVLAALAATIDDPVLLDRAGGGVLYHATNRTEPATALATWEEIRSRPGAHLDLEAVIDGEEALVVPVPGAGDTIWGHLAALALDSPLDSFARVAVERGVALIALALLRSRQEELLAARERGNFLAEVAAGRVAAAEAAHRAEALGFESRGRVLVPLSVVLRGAPSPAVEADATAVWRALRGEMAARATPVLIGTRSAEEALLVVAAPSFDERTETIERLVAAIRSAAQRHLGDPDLAVVAAGAAVAGWGELAAPLTEAAQTADAARAAPARPWHDTTIPDLDRLLWRLRGSADVQAFVRRRLGPLLEHDARRAVKLTPTLEALCERGGRKAETARALHLERQSLYHRIDRIQELLGVDLDNADDRLGLHLALRWRRHTEP
jgi:purine catabolism regulator